MRFGCRLDPSPEFILRGEAVKAIELRMTSSLPVTYAILNFVRKNRWFPLVSILLLVLILLQGFDPVQASPNPQATILKSIFIQSPREGQALQGVQIIEGKIRGEGFQQRPQDPGVRCSIGPIVAVDC